MIQLRTDDLREPVSPVVGHLADTLTELCSEHVRFDPEHFGEIAKAVESFLASCGGQYVDSNFLVLLASQALNGAGENAAARRMLILGSGLVVPSEWEVSREKDTWTLDLRRITLPAEARMELTLFTCLTGVLEGFGDVWDGTRGKGVLGLRHVCATAWAFVAAPSRKRKAMALTEEIKALCRRKLESMAERRDWNDVPEVMNLDVWNG
jgi:hypothetical protein